MNQSERRKFLIQELLRENTEYSKVTVPKGATEEKQFLRGLMNIRAPKPIGKNFLRIQDEYLREETKNKGITELASLMPIEGGIYLWRGDITTLKCGAIVNAANSGMTGCYYPCHNCIDNCIHTYAGIQLRLDCAELMESQGYEEPTGQAKITPAYNLPCDYVIHTVGPIVRGKLKKQHCDLLASCYRSCLKLADETGITSIAFCCISTGVFMFPNEKAAEIAVQTVKEYKAETGSKMEVIFNVFKESDEQIYSKILG